MGLISRSQNNLVDVILDQASDEVVGFVAKGGKILRDSVKEAEDDARAGRLDLDEDRARQPDLPDAHQPRPDRGRCR